MAPLVFCGSFVLFAQEGGGGSLMGMLPLFLIIGVLFYFMIIMPHKKEQARSQAMLDNLKKNDQVITAGGIRGVVVNVAKGDPYVTIRVDESNNTRLKMLRSAISRVVNDKDEVDGLGPKKEPL